MMKQECTPELTALLSACMTDFCFQSNSKYINSWSDYELPHKIRQLGMVVHFL